MKENGFTLMELLVVIAVVGLLAAVILVSLNSARQKAKIVKVKADLHQLVNAIYLLVADTGKYPNGCRVEAIDSAETTLNSAWAGLATQPQIGHDTQYSQAPGNCGWVAADLPNWQGPYSQTAPDPWGHPYFFDPDFEDAGGVQHPAVQSWGADGVPQYFSNWPNSDDIVLFLR